MKITSKPGNGNKIHIYIDGEYTLTLYDDYWHRAGFRENQEITDEELALLTEEAGFRSAYEKGLRLLGVRPYSEKELYRKLTLKFSKESSLRAIEKIKSYGYIDDESYAEEFAKHLYEHKKYDVKRIKNELKSKGISDEIILNTLKTLDNNPIERIIVMLNSKYENGFANEKDERRFVNKLIRMGYSFGDIKSAFYECGFTFHNNF